jgi:hypothetical protein
MALGSSAQNVVSPNCQLFGALHFKNGIAKTTIKVFCNDLTEAPPPPRMDKLDKKRKNSSYYTFYRKVGDSGSQICFIADDCAQQQFAALGKQAHFSNTWFGKYVRLDCLVFENVPGFEHAPCFVITDGHIQKGDNKPVQSIEPLQYFQDANDEEGLSFFGNDGQMEMKGKALLVLNNKQTAYIKTKDGKTLYFKRKERKITNDGYMDSYTGDAGSFELGIYRIISTGPQSSYRFGHLTIDLKNTKFSIDVFGDCFENDGLNKL